MLEPGAVHVWIVEPETIREPALLQRYEGLLSPEERERQRRFFFARHRHAYLVSHALLRVTLSRYAPLEPAAWTFARNQYGRPEIAAGGPRHLRFNLSHTEGLAALAVTRERDVGVDVEDTWRQGQTVEIAERYFARREVAALRALPASEQRDRFFDYWTLKEAYLKARGLGLSLPLAHFAFHLQPGHAPRICFDGQLSDDPDAWQFALLDPTARHRLALAVRSPTPLALRVRQTVPLLMDAGE